MKNSLFKTFFSSGLQAIAVQILGVLFFYIAADYLSKDDFGIINWVNATAIIITSCIGFGLDQIVVRRIAASKSSNWAGAAYLFHTFISSIIAFILLLLFTRLFTAETSFNDRFRFLPWFFAVQAILYMGLPLKQFLNAKHNFTPYAVIAVVSNVVKIILVIVFVKLKTLSIINVGVILAVCGIIEFISLLLYVILKTDFSFRFKAVAYSKLIKEAFPQYVSSIFDISLSRMDWVMLGILSTTAITAEYSVAYRAFEISRLPITVIAPVILNVFAKMLLGSNRPEPGKQSLIRELYTVEIFAAMMLPLVMNIIWSPIIDYFFKGKYGSVNAAQFLILSLCIPLMFIINLLWTLCFSIKKYKQISTITVLGAICNIILNLILIPQFDALGAAIAFVLTVIVQLSLYYRLAGKYVMSFPVTTLIILFLIAAGSFSAAIFISDNMFLRLFIATGLYIGISFVSGTVRWNHFITLKQLFRK